MRKIQLKEFVKVNEVHSSKPRTNYEVHLGNGFVGEFSKLHDCKKFLAETSEFLNETLITCNTVLINIYLSYRKSWFYMKPLAFSTQKVYVKELMDRELDQITQYFDIVFAPTLNANKSTFDCLNHIIEHLISACALLIEFYKEKRRFVDVREMKSIIQYLEHQKNKINNYK